MTRPKLRLVCRAYTLALDAVERGIDVGWRRAEKHTTRPTETERRGAIFLAVIESLNDLIDWEKSS